MHKKSKAAHPVNYFPVFYGKNNTNSPPPSILFLFTSLIVFIYLCFLHNLLKHTSGPIASSIMQLSATHPDTHVLLDTWSRVVHHSISAYRQSYRRCAKLYLWLKSPQWPPTIESFYVTSYQANSASHHTHDLHMVSSLCRTVLENTAKCPDTFLYLVQTLMPNYNQVKRRIVLSI